MAAFPLFSAFAAQNFGARVPIAIYCGMLLVMALLNMRLQRMVTRAPIVDEDATPERIALVRRRGRSVVLGAATAFAVSFVVPLAGQTALATIPLWRKLLERRDARQIARAT